MIYRFPLVELRGLEPLPNLQEMAIYLRKHKVVRIVEGRDGSSRRLTVEPAGYSMTQCLSPPATGPDGQGVRRDAIAFVIPCVVKGHVLHL
jgi:hypothetical protein